MRNIISITTSLVLALSLFACTQKKKEMTVKDFARIDIEITKTDLKPESKRKIAEKYGYTLEQYESFANRVEKDTKLQEKLGEIRLKDQKKAEK